MPGMLLNMWRYWRIIDRLYGVGELFALTLLHYSLFWLAMIACEAADANIIQPVNFWHYYWTTMTTVGYGDLSPATMLGRFLNPFFQISGIGIAALYIGKVAMWGLDQIMLKRRGLMPTKTRGHILVLGDFNELRVSELLGNAIFDRLDDGGAVAAVGCFRNTGDKNPFEKDLSHFHHVIPEYVQASSNGFGLKTLRDANVEHAHSIYIVCDDDTTAIGIIGALSHFDIKAPIAVLLREKSSEEIMPETDLDLHVILPAQALLAVRELEDPGSGAAIAELIDVERDESIYSFAVAIDGVREYQIVRTAFQVTFGERGILLGIARRNGMGWKTKLRAPSHEPVRSGDRIIYIADSDFGQQDVNNFNKALVA